jgi:hypothetical protein
MRGPAQLPLLADRGGEEDRWLDGARGSFLSQPAVEARGKVCVMIITSCKIRDDTEARCLVTQFGKLAYICGTMTTGAPPQDTATTALGAGTKSHTLPARGL